VNSPIPFLRVCLIFCAMAVPPATSALEINGIDFPDEAILDECPLILNGTATRTVWGIKVYVVGLFLGERNQDSEAIMKSDPMPKRVRIAMLREVSEEQFVTTIQENIIKNLSEEERARFEKEVAAFFACFNGGSSLKKGGVITIDYLPGKGMIIGVNDQQFEPIPGDEFYHTLLRLWIGEPLQKSIKDGLLGKVE
jgi:hypothetical protein